MYLCTPYGGLIMTVYFNEVTQTYFCNFRYKNYLGDRKGKTKRGFKTYDKALKWETLFMTENQGFGELTFKQFSKIFLNDSKNRIMQSTFSNKENYINARLIPYFGDIKIKDIKPLHVREWQNSILKQKLSLTYIKNLNGTLSQMMRLAQLMFDLPVNPCDIAKPIGKNTVKRYPIISPSNFKLLINIIPNEELKLIFQTFYFTGIRLGELLSLTPNDIDFDIRTIHITKSLTRLHGVTTVSEPKSKSSIRKITIPESLNTLLNKFTKGMNQNDFIFNITKDNLYKELRIYCEKINHRKMRIHDSRHSHASYLIQTGTNLLEVSHRLGHKNLYTTLRTYAHYIPELQNSIPDRLEELWSTLQ